MKNPKNKIILTFSVFIVLDLVVWQSIIFSSFKNPALYFLDVGQGDSELIVLPSPSGKGSAKILIDGGRDYKVIDALEKVLPIGDRRIDLLVVTHPQLDHFGGFIDVVKRYKVGAIIWSGREGEISAWRIFKNLIYANKIPMITLAAEDIIHYDKSELLVLSPAPEFLKSKDLNSTSLVIKLINPKLTSLFTADSGFDIEEYLLVHKKQFLTSDILKVGHHGSRFSSGLNFLKAVSPALAVIEVGKNSYGHPTRDALNRIAAVHAQIFRTDKNGTIKVEAGDASPTLKISTVRLTSPTK